MVQRTYDIDPVLHQDFKTICSADNTTTTAVIQQLIASYVSENKNTIYAKSTETKFRLNTPKLYDENLKWDRYFKQINDEMLLDIWHRLLFLYSLSAKYTKKYDMQSEIEFKILSQKHPFEKTIDYGFLESRKAYPIGYTVRSTEK